MGNRNPDKSITTTLGELSLIRSYTKKEAQQNMEGHEMQPMKVTKKATNHNFEHSKNSCFYCKRPVGESHAEDCALVRKKVKMKITIEYETDIPAHYQKGDVEFQYNDSSWCADNLIQELEDIAEKGGCLCSMARVDHVEDISAPYLEE